ncbi:MAG: M56 family metallopeptidase [Solirubrobacteraceae bacterium]
MVPGASSSDVWPAVGSARRLYRLSIGLATLAVGVLITATALAMTSVDLGLPSFSALVEACRNALLPDLTLPSIAIALLGSLSLAAFALGLRSLVVKKTAQRRFLKELRVVDRIDIDGTEVDLVDDDRSLAFCACLLRPRVYLSTGALIALDDDELRAVVAHERHHQQRRDPLRLLAAHVLGDALFFLPILRRLRQRYAALAELAADEAAVAAVGDRAFLASALLTFGDRPDAQVVVGIAPERVDHLVGARVRWKLPVSLLVGAIVTLAGLIALGASAATSSSGAGMSLPFVLAQVCAWTMTIVPALFGATLLIASTRRLRAAGVASAAR